MSEQDNYSDRIQKVSPKPGDLLVVTCPSLLTMDQRERMTANLAPFADRLGVRVLVLDGGSTAKLQPGAHTLLEEQKKQTAILERMEAQQSLLIQALAEEQGDDPDAVPLTYMDGSRIS